MSWTAHYARWEEQQTGTIDPAMAFRAGYLAGLAARDDPLEQLRARCQEQQPKVHADDCDLDEDCSCA